MPSISVTTNEQWLANLKIKTAYFIKYNLFTNRTTAVTLSKSIETDIDCTNFESLPSYTIS